MSEAPAGLSILEKLFGFAALIIGALMVYLTWTDPPNLPSGVPSGGWFSSIFIVGGLVLIGVGIFLMIAKTE